MTDIILNSLEGTSDRNKPLVNTRRDETLDLKWYPESECLKTSDYWIRGKFLFFPLKTPRIKIHKLKKKIKKVAKEGYKWCPDCKENLSIEKFYINTETKNGKKYRKVSTYCKKHCYDRMLESKNKRIVNSFK